MTTIMWAECSNGHALTDVYVTPDGHRRCRICKRESLQRSREHRTERAKRYPNPPAVKPHKFRNWAHTVWAEMTEEDRFVVGHALGYMTLEEATA